MLLGVKDFDIDLFLRFDDKGIYIYRSDFETLPDLTDIIPLGSFDSDGKFLFTNLDYNQRVAVGLLFMERDLFVETGLNIEPIFRIDILKEEFKNIPEVVEFCDKYINRCNSPQRPDWCPDCLDEPECSIRIPLSEFSSSDIYYIILIYFNGIYRTVPEILDNQPTYDVLTDIDFERNRYNIMINIKDFFTKEFIYFLQTSPGSIPFANDYGTDIKKVIQTKNTDVQRIYVQDEIDFFVINFNKIYGELVQIGQVEIVPQFSEVGGDQWMVQVYATVTKERLTYRLIID